VARPGAFNANVHGARGLLALSVFVFHVVNSGLPTLPALTGGFAEAALRTLEWGVELFFAVSGFVIIGTLRRAAGPLAFLRDRAIRIFPVLWASVFVVLALGAVVAHPHTSEIGRHSLAEMALLLPANLLALPGMLPLDLFHPAAWSLSYEFAFYLVAALAWWGLGLGRGTRWTSPGGIALTAAAAVLLALYPRGLFFLPGVLAAAGALRTGLAGRLASFPLVWLAVFLAAWSAVQDLTPGHHMIAVTLLDCAADLRLPLAGIALVAACLGFAGIVAGHGMLGRTLRSAPFAWLGTVSYSLYLWHPVVMAGVKRGLVVSGLITAAGPLAQALVLLAGLPVSLAVAWVSQKVLEEAAGRWLRSRIRGELRHGRDPVFRAAAR